jgi:Cft2 family RNA processing exonuclease
MQAALDPHTELWPVPEKIDAILLSHDHVDHIGGLYRLAPHIPVYCTQTTAQSLPAGRNVTPLRYADNSSWATLR